MKKILLIMMMVMIVGSLYAADNYLEVGYIPTLQAWDYIENYSNNYNNELYFVKMASTINIMKYFNIGGWIKTYMLKGDDGYTFHPFYLDYYFDAYMTYEQYEIGFRHWCSHPQNLLEGKYDPIMSMQRAYEEIYIKIIF